MEGPNNEETSIIVKLGILIFGTALYRLLTSWEINFKEMNENMTPLEKQEIRGLNFNSVRAIIVCTAVIVSSVMTSYISLKSEISTIKMEKAGEDRYNELRLRTIELNVSSIQMNIENMKNQVSENTAVIKNSKDKN